MAPKSGKSAADKLKERLREGRSPETAPKGVREGLQRSQNPFVRDEGKPRPARKSPDRDDSGKFLPKDE